MQPPKHYKLPIQPIEVVQALDLNFATGSIVKYYLRAGKKQGESELKDLNKALDFVAFEKQNQYLAIKLHKSSKAIVDGFFRVLESHKLERDMLSFLNGIAEYALTRDIKTLELIEMQIKFRINQIEEENARPE